uniref:Si:ch73-261i21.5 n=1 Tax=Scophthalmus maximus TaxID=52904 RepID=A0A8D2ZSF9_SCOMX
LNSLVFVNSKFRSFSSRTPEILSTPQLYFYVVCGSQMVDLQILLCPIYFNGYNESLLALNSVHSKHQCEGTADWAADPPVVRFNFSITEEGITAYFSHVEYINISGMVCSEDPTAGAVTYHQEVMYRFSCRYPLQYLVNNTHMSVGTTCISLKHVLPSLLLLAVQDNSYSSRLQIPLRGLELKTRIFVEVKASNLSNRFHVLLDRCYATTTPFPINTPHHDLFVGCDRDGQTVIALNGQQQEARFSFETFRFIETMDAIVSTYYLHCATRLCLNSFCSSVLQRSKHKQKRSSSQSDEREGASALQIMCDYKRNILDSVTHIAAA